MKTDFGDGLERLFSKARGFQPDVSRVETGFETRVLARVRAEREQRERHVGLLDFSWRLVPAFGALVAALGIWYWASTPVSYVDMHTAFAAEYEYTLALNLTNGD